MTNKPPKTQKVRTDISFQKARKSKKFKELLSKKPVKRTPQQVQSVNNFLLISQHLLRNPQDQGHPKKISEAIGVPVTSVDNYFRKNHALGRDEHEELLNFENVKGTDIINRVLREDGEIMIEGLKKIKQAIKANKVTIPQLAEIVKLSAARYKTFASKEHNEADIVSKISPQTIVVLAQFIRNNIRSNE